MKEYIERQELIDHFFLGVDEEEAREENTGEIITFEDIDRLPTVTQADLESLAYERGARAFAEKVKDKMDGISPLYATDEYDYCKAELLNQVDGKIDELLKEMGCNNE